MTYRCMNCEKIFTPDNIHSCSQKEDDLSHYDVRFRCPTCGYWSDHTMLFDSPFLYSMPFRLFYSIYELRLEDCGGCDLRTDPDFPCQKIGEYTKTGNGCPLDKE